MKKKPVRIQMRRTKGFNLREYSKSLNGLDYVMVSRPSKWGNFLRLEGDMIYIDALYRRKLLRDGWVFLCLGDADKMLRIYERIVIGKYPGHIESHVIRGEINLDIIYWYNYCKKLDLSELKGKNLVCWCPENYKYCHANILLKIVNK